MDDTDSVAMHKYPLWQNVQPGNHRSQLVDEFAEIVEENIEVIELHLANFVDLTHRSSGGALINYIELALALENLDHLGEHLRFLAVLQVFILEHLVP